MTFGLFHNDDEVGRGRKYFNWYIDTTLVNLTYNKELDKTNWRATLYSNFNAWISDVDRPPRYDHLVCRENFDMKDYGGSLQLGFKSEKLGRFTAGTDAKYNNVDKKDDHKIPPLRESRTKGRQIYFSPFIQNELELFENKMSLILGGRLDWYKSYDGSLNDPLPRNPINIIYPEKSWYEFCPKFGVLYHFRRKDNFKGFYLVRVFKHQLFGSCI